MEAKSSHDILQEITFAYDVNNPPDIKFLQMWLSQALASHLLWCAEEAMPKGITVTPHEHKLLKDYRSALLSLAFQIAQEPKV